MPMSDYLYYKFVIRSFVLSATMQSNDSAPLIAGDLFANLESMVLLILVVEIMIKIIYLIFQSHEP